MQGVTSAVILALPVVHWQLMSVTAQPADAAAVERQPSWDGVSDGYVWARWSCTAQVGMSAMETARTEVVRVRRRLRKFMVSDGWGDGDDGAGM